MATDPVLTDLPIHRIGRHSYALLLFLALPAALAIVGLALIGGGQTSTGWVTLLGRQPSILVELLGFLAVPGVLIASLFRHAALTIDSIGVHVSVNRKDAAFAWSDIAGAEILHTRYNNNCIRVTRKGEFAENPEPYLIWPEFGLPAGRVLDIINAGIAQWGGPTRDQPPSVADGGATLAAARRQLARVGATVAGLFLVVQVVCLGPLLKLYFDGRILRVRGVDATATITEKYMVYHAASHGRTSPPTPHAVYTFSLPDQTLGRGDEQISDEEDQTLAVGSTAPVLYDPTHPSRVELNENDQIRRGNIGAILWLALGLEAFFCVLFGGLLLAFVAGYRRLKRRVATAVGQAPQLN